MSEMYNPSRYQTTDQNEAYKLMDEYPFATVITIHDGKPYISHIPLTPKKVENKIELIGHLARANPHSRYLHTSEVSVIFNGPHTFVTPKWYVENDVPTWNYSTVHVNGHVQLIEDYDGILKCLEELTIHVERHWPSGWEFFVPDDLKGDVLPKSIVGFKITVDKINFKKKLSQNRNTADRAGVMRGLETRTDDNSRAVLKEMLALYSIDGENK